VTAPTPPPSRPPPLPLQIPRDESAPVSIVTEFGDRSAMPQHVNGNWRRRIAEHPRRPAAQPSPIVRSADQIFASLDDHHHRAKTHNQVLTSQNTVRGDTA
jgi:hypothetical protein